jgi:hypothetical protein
MATNQYVFRFAFGAQAPQAPLLQQNVGQQRPQNVGHARDHNQHMSERHRQGLDQSQLSWWAEWVEVGEGIVSAME